MSSKYLILVSVLVVCPMLWAQSKKAENRVNEHLQKTHKKIEIEGERREVELKKTAPKKTLKPVQVPAKKQPFMVVPPAQQQVDKKIMPDQYDHGAGKDPSTEFEQQVIDGRNKPTLEEERAEYIRQFKENAAKAGVKVEVDPKTLEARPVGTGTR